MKRLEMNYDIKKYVKKYKFPCAEELLFSALNIKDKVKHSYNNHITGKNNSLFEKEFDCGFFDKQEDLYILQNIITTCFKKYAENCDKNNIPRFGMLEHTIPRANIYEEGTQMNLHNDHISTIFEDGKGLPAVTVLGLLQNAEVGGELMMWGNEQKINMNPGEVILFPSNFLYSHSVTLIEKGTRVSFVSWIY